MKTARTVANWLDAIRDKIKYAVWQEEVCPRTRRRHIQAYVFFNKSIRGTTLGSWLELRCGGHQDTVPGANCDYWFLVARGTPKQNYDYCTKLETWDDNPQPARAGGEGGGPFIMGSMDDIGMGKRSDLSQAVEMVMTNQANSAIAQMFPRVYALNGKNLEYLRAGLAGAHDDPPLFRPEPLVLVLKGPTGIGKSWFARTWVLGLKDAQSKQLYQPSDIYALSMPTQRGAKVWLQGYRNQKVVIFEEFSGQIDYDTIKVLTDRYGCRVEIKNSHSNFDPKVIIFTTNFLIRTWWRHPITHDLLDQTSIDAFMRRVKYNYTWARTMPGVQYFSTIYQDRFRYQDYYIIEIEAERRHQLLSAAFDRLHISQEPVDIYAHAEDPGAEDLRAARAARIAQMLEDDKRQSAIACLQAPARPIPNFEFEAEDVRAANVLDTLADAPQQPLPPPPLDVFDHAPPVPAADEHDEQSEVNFIAATSSFFEHLPEQVPPLSPNQFTRLVHFESDAGLLSPPVVIPPGAGDKRARQPLDEESFLSLGF